MPINYLLVEALDRFATLYGEDTRFECPVGSGRYLGLREIADELARRLNRLFLRGPDRLRPMHGESALINADPHLRDLVPFHEYFHGETGAGLGAMHQTGWTGLVALLLNRTRPS